MNAKSSKIITALCAALTMIALPALAEDRGPAAPEFFWHDIGGIAWRFHGNARIIGDELVCEADASNRTAYAVGTCDLSEYDGKPMQMQIVASAEGAWRPTATRSTATTS